MKKLLILTLIVILILLIPTTVRSLGGNPYLMGGESYFDLRMGLTAQDGLINSDPVQKTQYNFNLFHFILAGLFHIGGAITISKFLPVILGALSIVMIYKLLENAEHSWFSLIIIIASPIFIFIFTTLNKYSVVIPLGLLAFILHKKNWVGWILLAPIFLIDLASYITLVVIFLVISKRKHIYSLITSIIILIGVSFLLSYNPLMDIVFSAGLLQNAFTEFGTLIGHGIFIFLLGIGGLVIFWKNQRQNRLLKSLIVILIIISFFNPAVRIITSFILAAFAGLAVHSLVSKKWSLNLVKNFTLLALICGILLASLSFAVKEINMEPSVDSVKGFYFLKTAEPDSVILSNPENGFFIEYFGQRTVFIDEKSFTKKGFKIKENISNTIFMSRSLKEIEPLMKEYKISHILIDEKMLDEIWDRNDQGLLFILKNSDKFVKVYDGKNKIYRKVT